MPETNEKTLLYLLIENLRDIYDGEKQIMKALPKMAKACESSDLRDAFEAHLEETRIQVSRLESAFAALGIPARGKKCEGIAGLLKEGAEAMEIAGSSSVRDAALIAAAQKVEHYEIACYGTLCTWAKQLELDEVKTLLGDTLEEEKSADEKMTDIATGRVNEEAAVGAEA